MASILIAISFSVWHLVSVGIKIGVFEYASNERHHIVSIKYHVNTYLYIYTMQSPYTKRG